MITYVDTSTLLKLIIDENGSERAMTIWTSADAVTSVSLIAVEARAALAAARRGSHLTEVQLRAAIAELEALVSDLHIVPVTDDLVASAAELADTEGLRGYDAVHRQVCRSRQATESWRRLRVALAKQQTPRTCDHATPDGTQQGRLIPVSTACTISDFLPLPRQFLAS